MAQQDPWDELLHDITGSFCTEKCGRKQADVMPLKQLVSSQTTDTVTNSLSYKKPSVDAVASAHSTSHQQENDNSHWSASSGSAIVDSATDVQDNPLAVVLARMPSMYVCYQCRKDFKRVHQLRKHASRCHNPSAVIKQLSSQPSGVPSILAGNMPMIMAAQVSTSHCNTPGVVPSSNYPSGYQSDFLALFGLQPKSSQCGAGTTKAKPDIIASPLIDIRSPSHRSPSAIAVPRTPMSLISQLRSPPCQKSGTYFLGSNTEGGPDESSSDESNPECRVVLLDLLKAPPAPLIPGSSSEVAVSLGHAAPVAFPRWSLGIDLSSPLGMQLMTSFGIYGSSRCSDVLHWQANAMPHKSLVNEFQKLRDRDVQQPSVYRQPKRQKFVRVYKFKNRCGKVSAYQETKVQPHYRQSRRKNLMIYSPRLVLPSLPSCTVRISDADRKAADLLVNGVYLHDKADVRTSDKILFPPELSFQEYRGTEKWCHMENDLPLSLQVSEEVHAELMELQNALYKAALWGCPRSKQ